MPALTDRERYVRYLTGQDVDRTPFAVFWGPWGTAWQRWKAEGCPFESFDAVMAHYRCEVQRMSIPINAGPCPRIEEVRLEENDESFIWTDGWGIRRKNFKHSESMSQFLEFPIKGWDDWRRFKAERLDPMTSL